MSHFEKRKEKSSCFVRFFYQNKRFRLRRMKKKNTRFFGMKCLQSRSAFRLFRQYGFDEALGPCHTCDFLIPECHRPTFHKPFKKHSIYSLLLVAEVVSVQVVVVQTVSLQTGMARRNRLVGEYKVKPYYLITGVNKMLSIWIYFLYCNIKSTITIIPIIINLIDAEWPIVLSLRNVHNKPIIIQHRA